jgi:hypothetical protein
MNNPAIPIARIEAPHLVYPKGPIRKIVTYRNVQDAIVGEVILVTLECTHTATLVGQLTSEALVRCPTCFFEKHKGTEQIVDGNE